jgi:hypothetical protein
MSKEKRSDTTKETTTSTAGKASLTDIQAKADQETSQGFRGTEVDPTPNENYTVAGVTSGAPTPETDAAHAAEVRKTTGTGLSALEAADLEKTQRGEK